LHLIYGDVLTPTTRRYSYASCVRWL